MVVVAAVWGEAQGLGAVPEAGLWRVGLPRLGCGHGLSSWGQFRLVGGTRWKAAELAPAPSELGLPWEAAAPPPQGCPGKSAN